MAIEGVSMNITAADAARVNRPKVERNREPEAEDGRPAYTAAGDDGDAPKRSEIMEAVTEIADSGRFLNRRLQLEVEEELEIIVAKVVDKESGDVIRQIPPEELVALSKRIKEHLEEGLLINEQV